MKELCTWRWQSSSAQSNTLATQACSACKYWPSFIVIAVLQFTSIALFCRIYEWLGTTMDMKHAFPAPELRKISVLQSSDSVHLVLIHGESSIHLRRFTDLEETELLEIVDIDLERLYQLDVFLMNSQWCLLLAGSNNSFIYCLHGKNSVISHIITSSCIIVLDYADQRLLQWQVLLHTQTFSSVSWMRIQQDGIRESYDSVLLIFNAFDSQVVTNKLFKTFIGVSILNCCFIYFRVNSSSTHRIHPVALIAFLLHLKSHLMASLSLLWLSWADQTLLIFTWSLLMRTNSF